MDLSPLAIGLIGLGVFLFLVLLGIPVAFAGALVGAAGIFALKGFGAMLGSLGYLPYSLIASYPFAVIPMFILMGFFAYQAGIATDTFNAIKQWLGHIPGGIAIATVFGCAAFGATSGSSTAAAAVFGKVAVPEMRKYGYDKKLATGTVAASGSLASMIPPSIMIVIYGLLTEVSVAALLIAGIIPGIFQAILYSGMLYARVRLKPTLAPSAPPALWKARFSSLKGVWGLIVIFATVIGGIYTGVFTPTEAGAVAAFAALVIGLSTRKLTRSGFNEALIETAKTTTMILTILVGTLMFMHFLALSGCTKAVMEFVATAEVGRMVILGGMLFIYLVVGCFVSATAMVMLTIPIFYPAIVVLGFDPIWFGIIVVTMCEIAVMTPPLGLNVYTVSMVVPDVTTWEVFTGVFPFIIVDIIRVAILVAFPMIILFLPQMMFG